MRRRLASAALTLLLAATIGLAAWASFAPIHTDSRDELFEIPHGTYAARMAARDGEKKAEILPDTIRLTLGAHDVLLLRNLDEVPQVFGPTLIMPGQSLRLPFEVASIYSFACTAHASGQMNIIVEPMPARGWARLEWRMKNFKKTMGKRDT